MSLKASRAKIMQFFIAIFNAIEILQFFLSENDLFCSTAFVHPQNCPMRLYVVNMLSKSFSYNFANCDPVFV